MNPRYKWYAFAAMAVGTFASVVDHGSVTVALPSIAAHFHSDIPTVQWLVIGFAMTIIALLLPMGRLADLVGSKKVYVAGSLVLVAGSISAGLSSDLMVLILSRIVQGTGAAMTQGTGMAIVIAAFPPSERGKAIGLIMTMVGTGAIAGPATGGILVDALGWRAVFFGTVPLVLISVAMALAIIRDNPRMTGSLRTRSGRFDWFGAGISSAALMALLLGITHAHKTGWTSWPILAAGPAFLFLSGLFVWWELKYPYPMLQLRLFRRRNFSQGVTSNFLMFLGSSAVLFMTPFYLQNVLGYRPSLAGLVVVPGACCMALIGPLSGHLSDRFGWRKFTVGGTVLSITGVSILSNLSEDSSLFLVVPALMLQSSGMGMFYSPNTSSILSAVRRNNHGVVSGFLNLIRNAGNVVSVAIATAIVASTMGAMGYEPSLDAIRTAAGSGVESAFTLGLKYAYLTMVAFLVCSVLVSTLRLRPGIEAPSVPRTHIEREVQTEG